MGAHAVLAGEERVSNLFFETNLSGTTFEGRPMLLAKLKTSADDTTLGVLRESQEYDGIEVMLCRHKSHDIEPMLSLGWIPAKLNGERKVDGRPTEASPLVELRGILEGCGIVPDDFGIYVGVAVCIVDVPGTGRRLGVRVGCLDVREE